MTKSQKRFIPILLAIAVIIGILIGSFFTSHFSNKGMSIIHSSNNKINDLLHLINDEYVDTVNLEEVIENTLPDILRRLDPHSTYIPANRTQEQNEMLSADFSGIGLQLLPIDDTLRVTYVIPGSPAAKVGIKPFDNLLAIDDSIVSGANVKKINLHSLFVGPIGSKIKLRCSHPNDTLIENYTLYRSQLPQKSIDAAYNILPQVGYIHIRNFCRSTYSEFLASIASLSKEKPIKHLIIDMRGNTGGYMRQAIQLANEFLPKDKLIIFTKGRKSPKEEYFSDGRGAYQQLPLTVLIDEMSASASEIFAGAMQDNDRATCIGRRSFGKGLVQIPIKFRDGSIIRLTQSRYYTPTGRCVQKPYGKHSSFDYQNEISKRYDSGEIYGKDSIPHTGKQFVTPSGRIVYGGGGITPDIVVKADSTGDTSYFRLALKDGYISSYAYVMVQQFKDKLLKISLDDNFKSFEKFLDRRRIINNFPYYASKKGLRKRNRMFYTSYKLFRHAIYTQMIFMLYGEEEMIKYENTYSKIVREALEDYNAKRNAKNTTNNKQLK